VTHIIEQQAVMFNKYSLRSDKVILHLLLAHEGGYLLPVLTEYNTKSVSVPVTILKSCV